MLIGMTTHTESGPNLDTLRDAPPTISIAEAAPYLGISKAFCYQMSREGKLPVIRLGGKKIRVKTAALLAMLETDD